MSIISTANSGVNVRIIFYTPASNGAAITKYQILLQSYDGSTYYETTTYCDGSSLTVIANMYCDVPMSVLIASPYSLTYGVTVKAKAKAYNSNGWGSFSQPNVAGATI